MARRKGPGGRRPGAGRKPSLSPEERATAVAAVRFPPRVLAEVRELAAVEGRTVGAQVVALVRSALVECGEARARAAEDIERLPQS